ALGGACVRGRDHRPVPRGPDQGLPGEVEDRVAVGRPERIPEAAALVVDPEILDIHPDQPGMGQTDRDPFRLMVDVDPRRVLEIETHQGLAGYDNQVTL